MDDDDTNILLQLSEVINLTTRTAQNDTQSEEFVEYLTKLTKDLRFLANLPEDTSFVKKDSGLEIDLADIEAPAEFLDAVDQLKDPRKRLETKRVTSEQEEERNRRIQANFDCVADEINKFLK